LAASVDSLQGRSDSASFSVRFLIVLELSDFWDLLHSSRNSSRTTSPDCRRNTLS
jgi:hypothetical protein